ncbi:MAG: heme exporter protein [Bacteroidota bacterium]|nr:heme exporter protein [Bacteroidota bacterium]
MTKRASIIKIALAVLEKDLRSEFRTRYAISSVLLFILTAVTMLIFSIAGQTPSKGIASGLLWVVMFFGAMTGLSKSFVSEEDRGTSLYLQISAISGAVYLGKLLFNILLSLSLNIFTSLLFLLFIDSFRISSFGIFLSVLFIGSIALASATTIISAIIARANSKNTLFPVLSFPVLLPLIMLGVETTLMSLEGGAYSDAAGNLQAIAAYSGIMITASFLLFDFIWKD